MPYDPAANRAAGQAPLKAQGQRTENARTRRVKARAAGTHPSKTKRTDVGRLEKPSDKQARELERLSRVFGEQVQARATWEQTADLIARLHVRETDLKHLRAATLPPSPLRETRDVSGPATEKQRAFLISLYQRIGLAVALPNDLTRDEASQRIEQLKQSRSTRRKK